MGPIRLASFLSSSQRDFLPHGLNPLPIVHNCSHAGLCFWTNEMGSSLSVIYRLHSTRPASSFLILFTQCGLWLLAARFSLASQPVDRLALFPLRWTRNPRFVLLIWFIITSSFSSLTRVVSMCFYFFLSRCASHSPDRLNAHFAQSFLLLTPSGQDCSSFGCCLFLTCMWIGN